MKTTPIKWCAFGTGLLMWLAAANAMAYSLNLPPTYPDVTTFNASINYTATCINDLGGTGTCGLSASTGGTGSAANKAIQRRYDVQTSGLLTITGTTMSINVDGTGSTAIISGNQGLSYTLTAQFDATGTFVTAGSTIAIKGKTASNPNFQSGDILTANLTQLGFQGSGTAGTFYFTFDNNVQGDMAAYYTGYSGVIGSTTNMTTGTTCNVSPYCAPGWTSGTWDPTNNNNPGFFYLRGFTATSNVDTFVPLPAAAWLFGSGLLGLVGVARRHSPRT